MSFPFDDYEDVIEEAYAIVEDRDAKGRNAVVGFYALHKLSDIGFELRRRVARIEGSIAVGGEVSVRRDDVLDLLNYAAFYVMLLDHGTNAEGVPVPVASETPTSLTQSAPQ